MSLRANQRHMRRSNPRGRFAYPGSNCRKLASQRPFRNWLSGMQLIEQCLRLLQIARVEPFRKPTVDRSQQFARLLHLALVTPEARDAHCGAEFPGFGLLLARDRECVLEIGFRFGRSSAQATSSAISPALRMTSASHHLSLVVSTAVIASPMTAPSFIKSVQSGIGCRQKWQIQRHKACCSR